MQMISFYSDPKYLGVVYIPAMSRRVLRFSEFISQILLEMTVCRNGAFASLANAGVASSC